MSRSHWSNLVCFLVLLLCLADSRAQEHFSYKAELERVKNAGYYQVNIPPLVGAFSFPDFTDLRLQINDSSYFVPYILETEGAAFSANFTAFPIVLEGMDTARNQFTIVENNNRVAVEQLSLSFRNSLVDRLLSISGSDDGKQWFAIREHIPLEDFFSVVDTGFVQSVQLPVIHYRYIRISQLTRGALPVKFLQAGVFANSLVEGRWQELPDPLISQKDSVNKSSYIQLDWKAPFSIDRIVLQFASAQRFKRRVSIYSDAKQTSLLAAKLMEAGGDMRFDLKIRGNKLWLKVENEDDKPLQLQAVKAFQVPAKLIAYLEAGKQYRLLFGDSALTTAPKYDLKFFKDSIPKTVPLVQIAALERIPKLSSKSGSNGRFSQWLMWACIAVVLVLLVVVSMRLAADIGKRVPRDP